MAGCGRDTEFGRGTGGATGCGGTTGGTGTGWGGVPGCPGLTDVPHTPTDTTRGDPGDEYDCGGTCAAGNASIDDFSRVAPSAGSPGSAGPPHTPAATTWAGLEAWGYGGVGGGYDPDGPEAEGYDADGGYG